MIVFKPVLAVPIVEQNTYIVNIAYSPLVGGFAIVLNDGRAAFLTASTLRFDPNVSILNRIARSVTRNISRKAGNLSADDEINW